MKHKINLYQFERCPFCRIVREKLNEKNLEFEIIEVSKDRDSTQRKMLFEKTGVMTMPVIEIDGKFIGETKNILERLDNL